MITVEKATEKDIREFADNIRYMDEKEVKIVSGKPFRDQLDELIRNKKHVKVIRCDGVLLGIGGWYKEMLDWGLYSQGVVGWMLLTPAVEDHKIAFLRWSKWLVKCLLDAYPYITNTAYIGNTLHIRFLEFLGASFHPDPFNSKLVHFYIERS